MSLKRKMLKNASASTIKDRIFYLTHEVRKPLTDLVVICDILRKRHSKADYQKVYGLLNVALNNFDQVIREYDKISTNEKS
ncbi:hypothetical protein [Reichenbachiella sp.]|uniref:hypothetical protein n=1 Tax=Reichenbachiella sp. TaxID=2184521 RepID=UPI003297FC04